GDSPQAELEALGMARTEQWLEQAALILMVIDQSQKLTDFDAKLYCRIKDKPHLLLLNKQDKKPAFSIREIRDHLSYQGPILGCVGAKDQVEIDAVVAGIADFIKLKTAGFNEATVMISQQRHYDLLRVIAAGLNQALELIKTGAPPLDMLAEELHQLRFNLLEITGAESRDAEGLLDIVFSNFCVGK
ncbi:MAG: hypothetical protein KAG92_00985, partial [Deltaproteobacteria bacterium]|nr:hypothetical protein [Deltaproteobacteria bacterium]